MPYENEPLNAGPRRNTKFHDVVVIVTLPWLLYVLVLCVFLFCFHHMEAVAWMIVAVCFGVSLLFLVLGICLRIPSSLLFKALGILCLASTVVATLVGLWLHENYLGRYYTLMGDVVGPLDPHVSPGSQEISVYQFINGTFVDDKRTLGLEVDGKMYCVAPVSKPMAYNDSIEYWATGEDCCEPQQHFDCGSARIPGSVMAIVQAPNENYDKAIIEATAKYNSVAPGKPHLVIFIEGADQYKEYLWCLSLTIYLSSAALNFLMCAIAGAIYAKWPNQRGPGGPPLG